MIYKTLNICLRQIFTHDCWTVRSDDSSLLFNFPKPFDTIFLSSINPTPILPLEESGSDEDFMVEDDDDSDYGRSKKKGKKVIGRRGRPERKDKKSPKPRLKATGMS